MTIHGRHVRRFDRSSILYAIGWVLLVIGGVVYVNVATDATINCLYRATVAGNESTEERAEAADRRDTALVKSKQTMREIVRLRVLENVNQSPELEQLAADYIRYTGDYVQAQKDLDRTRRDNPVPDIREMCP